MGAPDRGCKYIDDPTKRPGRWTTRREHLPPALSLSHPRKGAWPMPQGVPSALENGHQRLNGKNSAPILWQATRSSGADAGHVAASSARAPRGRAGGAEGPSRVPRRRCVDSGDAPHRQGLPGVRGENPTPDWTSARRILISGRRKKMMGKGLEIHTTGSAVGNRSLFLDLPSEHCPRFGVAMTLK